MLEYISNFIVNYWWHMLAVLIAPLLGFIAGQWFKALWRNVRGHKPSSWTTGSFNAWISGAFAFWFWPGSLEESAKIGLAVGMSSPIIVWVWFMVAARYAPKQVAQLKGTDGEDLTIIPWIYKGKNNEDV